MGKISFNKDKKEFKFTEETIQEVLDGLFSRNSVKYFINNLYVFDWESDKLLKTRSGYYYEFEIKISKSDFKNDFKNKKDKHIILEGDYKTNKYIPSYYETIDKYPDDDWYKKYLIDRLEKNPHYIVENHKRPNYFYYVCPENLINIEDVPKYAGLIYIDCDGHIIIVKSAPKLHSEKYTDEELNLSEKFYYNMETWKARSKKTLEYKQKLEEEIKSHGQKTSYKDLETKYKAASILLESSEKKEKILSQSLFETNLINHSLVGEIKKFDKDFDYFEFCKKVLDE
jgi:hypothetical protein